MKLISRMLVLLTLIAIIGGCLFLVPKSNPDYVASRSHHRPDGFVNRYGGAAGENPGLLRWQWERFRDGLPKPPAAPVLGVPANLALIQGDALQPRATWIGHATVLLQLDGLNVLTDPHWGERASPLSWAGPKRHQAPGVALKDLPRIDAVLISHNHWDHLDEATVQALMDQFPQIRFYVPLGVQYWFRDHVRGTHLDGDKANVFALDWDQTATLTGRTAEVSLTLASVQHWSSRLPWDRNSMLWGSWVVRHPAFKFWFSGDLGYSRDTQDIGAQYGPFDLAAIAIGAYAPRWFMRASHIDPSEAVQVMKDVRAQSALAIHWGTFERLTDEPLDQPPRDLQQALDQETKKLDFRVLKQGETWLP